MKKITSIAQKHDTTNDCLGLVWLSAGYIIVGIVLLVCTCLPESIDLSQICFAVGIIMILAGALSVLLYFVRKSYQNTGRIGFFIGLLVLCLGIYAVVRSLEFARIFSILISFCILTDSALKVQLALELLYRNQKCGIVAVIIGGVTLFLAMILLLDPFSFAGEHRDLMTYSALIIDGIANLIIVFMMRFACKKKMDSASTSV